MHKFNHIVPYFTKVISYLRRPGSAPVGQSTVIDQRFLVSGRNYHRVNKQNDENKRNVVSSSDNTTFMQR